MAEFIGSRISLVSKSDIRYVGTLHEINSETSTVALENVTSFGTEDRKPPAELIPPSDNVYEYIVFRGSDVKDLRIEEAPGAKENKPPAPPNDPAIMNSSGSRPQTQGQAQGQSQQRRTPQAQGPPQGQPPISQGPVPPNGPPFGHHPQFPPPFYPPPPAGWGRGGPPGPPFPGMPYGAPPPPGWYPPPGQGFPPGPFPHFGYPPGPPGQQFPQGHQPPKPAPIGPGANKQSPTTPSEADKQHEPKSLATPAAEMAAAAVTKGPTPPSAFKSSPSESKAPTVEPISAQTTGSPAVSIPTPKTGSAAAKSNRVQPALPLQSPAISKAPLQSQSGNVTSPAAQAVPAASLRDATQAATAAVAAAMAKLPGQSNGSAMDNLTKKVNEMRTNEPIRAPRHPGSSAGFATGRGGRGGRGGATRHPGQAGQKVEVPTTDFDFESSNAKFSKEDLVKEAIAGSPLGENPVASPTEPDVPVSYNKSTSFFDNISSESKDRADTSTGRPGGREWRGEEQKKNVETFGQGSVDNGYRGGFRGRGRGRGRGGFRGRGGYSGNGQPGQVRGGGYRGRSDIET